MGKSALDDINSEYKALNEKAIASMEKSNERSAKQMKRNVKHYLEDRADRVSADLRKYLGVQKNEYVNLVQTLINDTIKKELDKITKQLDEAKAAIEASDSERDKKLSQVKNDLKTAKDLLNTYADISSEIEASMKDKIEQQAL